MHTCQSDMLPAHKEHHQLVAGEMSMESLTYNLEKVEHSHELDSPGNQLHSLEINATILTDYNDVTMLCSTILALSDLSYFCGFRMVPNNLQQEEYTIHNIIHNTIQ